MIRGTVFTFSMEKNQIKIRHSLSRVTALQVTALALLALVGCTVPIYVQTPGTVALPPGSETHKVFTYALQAAMQSGLVPSSTDRDSGFISATKTFSNKTHTSLSIQVIEVEDGIVIINLISTLQARNYDDGTTTQTIRSYCRAFSQFVPNATFMIDGRLWVD